MGPPCQPFEPPVPWTVAPRAGADARPGARAPSTRREALVTWTPALLSLLSLTRPPAARAQPPSGATASALVLVTAPATGLDDLTQAELRLLFLRSTAGEVRGKKLVALNQPPGSPERELFDRRVLGMSPEQMARYWIDQKVRGQQSAPRSFAPPQILARMLERLPGSIGYLRPEHVTPALRAVRIDGQAPESPQYLLAARPGASLAERKP